MNYWVSLFCRSQTQSGFGLRLHFSFLKQSLDEFITWYSMLVSVSSQYLREH